MNNVWNLPYPYEPRVVREMERLCEILMKVAVLPKSSGMIGDSWGVGLGSKIIHDNANFCIGEYAKWCAAIAKLRAGRIKGIDLVDATEFPYVNLRLRAIAETRYYDEKHFPTNERPDLLALCTDRSVYSDAWENKTGLFDNQEEFEKELPETCVIKTCSWCDGKGKYPEKVTDRRSKTVKCPRCLGTGLEKGKPCLRCGGDGWVRKTEYLDKKALVTCDMCNGSGKLKHVLVAQHTPSAEIVECCGFFCKSSKEAVPESMRTIRRHRQECDNTLDHRVLLEISAKSGLVMPNNSDLSGLPISKDSIEKSWKKYTDEIFSHGTRCLSSTLQIEAGIRYVRFHYRMENRDGYFWLDTGTGAITNENGSTIISTKFFDKILNVASKIQLSEACSSKRSAESVQPNRDSADKNVSDKAVRENRKISSSQKKSSSRSDATPLMETADNEATDVSISYQKKRWKFVAIGILFGWIGAHFIYAKRWWLLALHIAFVCATIAFPPCAILYLLTWFGGAFFVKKDGSGNRMA